MTATITSTPATVTTTEKSQNKSGSPEKKGQKKSGSEKKVKTTPTAPAAKSTAEKLAQKTGGKPVGKPTIARKGHESKHSDLPQQEVVWNDRRKAIVRAMRKLNASSQTSAVTAGEIVKAAGLKDDTKPAIFRVRIVLDVYRTNELIHNGYAQSLRLDGERELRYYLTQRGMKVKLETGKE